MTRKLLVCCLFLGTALTLIACPRKAKSQTVEIISNGRSESHIVVEPGIPEQQRAAEILQHFLKEASGCTLPIEQALGVLGTKKGARSGDVVFSCQPSSRVREDGFEITTRGGNLVIAGEGKAAIYGAVEVLKRFVGMDYWGQTQYYVPECKDLIFKDLDLVSNPTFSYRQCQSYQLHADRDPLYKLWYRLEEPNEEFAGGLWVHTFNRILPADKYGESHPEYYAWFNGQRHPGAASQWCLSNPDVLEECCAVLDSVFRANPGLDMISISQNDGNNTNCRCPECAAADAEDGTPMGSLIRFINKVAERFPDKTISTLAYLYTVNPPKVTRPRENVSIMLCDIDCKREVPLTDNESGQAFMKALDGWSAMCKKLFVWDYGINFDGYLTPFPNFRTMKRNFEIFRDHNVTMHFSQISSSRGGDFAEMRAYIANELLWNASAPLDSLENHFLTRYYKAAAPYIAEYIHRTEDELLASGIPLWIYDSAVTHKEGMLRDEMLRVYDELFDKAEEAVADDAEALMRVRRSRLSLMFSKLEIDRTRTVKDVERVKADLKLFKERTAEFGPVYLNERLNTPEEYCELYSERYLSDISDNLAFGKAVSYGIEPSPAYRKLGATALTDGLFGGLNYVEGWVGWEGIDGVMTVDLEKAQTVHSAQADFLDKKGSWILMPLSVSFSYSADGVVFTPWSRTEIPENRDGAIRFVPISATSEDGIQARYIRIEVEGGKICPSWHYGVGNPSWFFIDEIIVR